MSVYKGTDFVAGVPDLTSYALDANVVHKTGNETITGTKTFHNNPNIETDVKDSRITIKFSDATIGTTPSENYYAGFKGVDSQDSEFANCNCSYKTNGTVGCNFYTTRSDSGSTVSGTLGVYIDSGGTSAYTKAPASDVNDSIVTTVNKSKGNNGYFKLGNGLIIQWGRSSQRTFTYPIPFSSDTSFSIVVNNQAGTDGYGRPDSVDNLTRTSCMVSSLAGYPVRWLAIGY